MPVTPVGELHAGPLGLAGLLSNSAAFRSAWGASDASEALALIWLYDVHLEDEGAVLPVALVDWAGDFDDEVVAVGSGSTFSSRGEVRFTAFLEVPEAYRDNKREALIWGGNVQSAIYEEIRGLSGMAGNIFVNHWRVLTPVLGPASSDVVTVEFDIFAGVGIG